MPYKRRADLPESVKDHLPAHAQDIYRKSYNNAWDEYNHEEDRAHAVAWAAVKKKYHKGEDGDWHKGASND